MEPYHRQPPADRADSKLKTAKKKDHTPPYFNRTVPTTAEPQRKKPVQPRHPPPASTKINRTVPTTAEPQRKKKPVQPRHPPQASTQINSTGPALHTAKPHAEGKYDPARQKTPGDPARPK